MKNTKRMGLVRLLSADQVRYLCLRYNLKARWHNADFRRQAIVDRWDAEIAAAVVTLLWEAAR